MVGSSKLRKVYLDADLVSFTVIPDRDLEFVFIQSEGDCKVNINLKPESNAEFKVKIYIYAEGTSSVDCTCTLDVGKYVSGVRTDIQIRSWPFDKSKIKARPEMFIRNSDVVATHGNALGNIDEDSQYYLTSRGVADYRQLIKQSLLDA